MYIFLVRQPVVLGYELALIVTCILNKSFLDRVVPNQWLTVVVTLVSKKTVLLIYLIIDLYLSLQLRLD